MTLQLILAPADICSELFNFPAFYWRDLRCCKKVKCDTNWPFARYKRYETKSKNPQFKSGTEILIAICCQHLWGLETCSSSWVGRSWTCSCLCPCSHSCMRDSCGFFSGSCSCLFPRSCCGSFPSLVDFSLLCMGSCCDLCRHHRLHVLPFHHCSSQLSHGCHTTVFHPAPCMHQLRPS